MDIEIFTLCDFASDFNGKLVVVGTFDTIWAQGFPCIHPTCALAARIRFNNMSAGDFKIRIQIVDEDGREIIPPMNGELKIPLPPAGTSVAANFVLVIGQLTFQKAGRYSIDLFINEAHQRSLPLSVNQAERPRHA